MNSRKVTATDKEHWHCKSYQKLYPADIEAPAEKPATFSAAE
ncbi:MAG: hypothetical protein WC028_25450 [Candidatus Obscuribacterales bacterium]